MMPIASVSATITVARTNWVSETHAIRPEESTRSRAARGKRRTSQDQIRSPSARKKYVANRMMNRPGDDVAEDGADLGDPADDLGVLAVLRDRLLGLLDPAVDLGVAGVERPVAQPVADLLEAVDDLPGEVLGTGRDLLADEGEQRDDEDQPADHDEAGPEPASDADPLHAPDDRVGQGGDQQRDDQRQHHDREERGQPQQQPGAGRDDQQPPGPGRGRRSSAHGTCAG